MNRCVNYRLPGHEHVFQFDGLDARLEGSRKESGYACSADPYQPDRADG